MAQSKCICLRGDYRRLLELRIDFGISGALVFYLRATAALEVLRARWRRRGADVAGRAQRCDGGIVAGVGSRVAAGSSGRTLTRDCLRLLRCHISPLWIVDHVLQCCDARFQSGYCAFELLLLSRGCALCQQQLLFTRALRVLNFAVPDYLRIVVVRLQLLEVFSKSSFPLKPPASELVPAGRSVTSSLQQLRTIQNALDQQFKRRVAECFGCVKMQLREMGQYLTTVCVACRMSSI
jgi:hypothetical protein